MICHKVGTVSVRFLCSVQYVRGDMALCLQTSQEQKLSHLLLPPEQEAQVLKLPSLLSRLTILKCKALV